MSNNHFIMGTAYYLDCPQNAPREEMLAAVERGAEKQRREDALQVMDQLDALFLEIRTLPWHRRIVRVFVMGYVAKRLTIRRYR